MSETNSGYYRVSPYYASSIRPKLIAGADRSLLVILTAMCVLVVYVWMTVWSFASAFTLFAIGQFWLRYAAKKDPLLPRVYLRSLTYGPFYPARGKYCGTPRRHQKNWVR